MVQRTSPHPVVTGQQSSLHVVGKVTWIETADLLMRTRNGTLTRGPVWECDGRERALMGLDRACLAMAPA